MKVLITGSADTPYAHGCYLFDLFFPGDYPTTPPKMQLLTTGNNKIRFNPNLYSNGYICLSLLGTWRGEQGETWTALSNTVQIFLSLQAIVMNEEVFFNEPGYEKEKNTAHGKKFYQAFSNIVKYANIKYAMID